MRSHFCGELNESFIGKRVTLCGWAHSRRDHGGVIFIDLRDRSGLVQVTADPTVGDAYIVADRARNEYVLRVVGTVRTRPEGTANPNLPSGEIEVLAQTMEIPGRQPSPGTCPANVGFLTQEGRRGSRTLFRPPESCPRGNRQDSSLRALEGGF